MDSSLTPHLLALADAFGFTLDDLAANRVGKLSEHQAWELAKSALVSAGIVIAAASGVAIAWRVLRWPLRVFSVFFVCAGSAWVYGMIQPALWTRAVSVSGSVHVDRLPNGLNLVIAGAHGDVRAYWPVFADAKLPGGELLSRAKEGVVEGDVYRVYYLPSAYLRNSGDLLSLEPLQAAAGAPVQFVGEPDKGR
jgi:hypothetical protein